MNAGKDTKKKKLISDIKQELILWEVFYSSLIIV